MVKQDDLVTVNLGENNTASNTYRVARKLDDECVLSHPLYPDCYIIKKDSEVDTVMAQLKGSTEHCLEYAKKFKKYLDYDDCSEIDALCLYFVVHRQLSGAQKKNLSNLCGKVASIYCQNDIGVAIKLTNENKPLLDSFNLMWVTNLKEIYAGRKLAKGGGQRTTIFNIAGFLLAQLENA